MLTVGQKLRTVGKTRSLRAPRGDRVKQVAYKYFLCVGYLCHFLSTTILFNFFIEKSFYLSDHVMVDFIKPNLLGTRKEFTNRFVNPINNGQCSNSTPRDVRIMKQRSHVLYQLLSGCVQVCIIILWTLF